MNLSVRSDLPPNGGPPATTIFVFEICFQKKFGLSYHPPWSKYCLNNSIGGWAPHSFGSGIFISSIYIKHFFPPWPHRNFFPLSCSNLFSKPDWISLLDVCAEKFILIKVHSSVSFNFFIIFWIIAVFPVPVSPVT